jgi:ribosomal protein S18 acetylase RimI-like enzyme
MIIRNAFLDDAESIAKIHVTAWRTGYRNILPDVYLKSLSIESRTKQWQDALANNNIGTNMVIEYKKIVSGFCVYGPVRDKDLNNLNMVEILALNISPDSWGMGFGTALIKHVINYASMDNKEKIYLWVVKENQRAKNLYENMGFLLDGSEKIDTEFTSCELHEVRYVMKLI